MILIEILVLTYVKIWGSCRPCTNLLFGRLDVLAKKSSITYVALCTGNIYIYALHHFTLYHFTFCSTIFIIDPYFTSWNHHVTKDRVWITSLCWFKEPLRIKRWRNEIWNRKNETLLTLLAFFTVIVYDCVEWCWLHGCAFFARRRQCVFFCISADLLDVQHFTALRSDLSHFKKSLWCTKVWSLSVVQRWGLSRKKLIKILRLVTDDATAQDTVTF